MITRPAISANEIFFAAASNGWSLLIRKCRDWQARWRSYWQPLPVRSQPPQGNSNGLLVKIEKQSLNEAVAELPKDFRAVFLLHDVYGYCHEQIAEQLGINVDLSRSQLHNARLKVRAWLRNQGLTETTASCRKMLTV